MQLLPTHRLTCPPEVLSRVLDGEAVLLHLGTGSYFGMNEVATSAWEKIAKGTTFGALREALLQEFEVDEAVLEKDLSDLVTALEAQRLVLITAAE